MFTYPSPHPALPSLWLLALHPQLLWDDFNLTLEGISLNPCTVFRRVIKYLAF